MSNFTPRVSFELQFEGDEVTMSLSRLQRDAVQVLMPHIETDEDGKVSKMGFRSQMEFAATTIEFLPQYVHDFAGLKDASGSVIAFDVVLKEVYFNDITTAIITKLFEISKMSEKEEGNSDAPSGTGTKGSVSGTRRTSGTASSR